ncbi:hypothetical protein KAT55_07460, partial [Candidatus Bathyarchaeota archaeon]|nr:hypothetical protein [Candidatus Bathyarchaeota archaeon]
LKHIDQTTTNSTSMNLTGRISGTESILRNSESLEKKKEGLPLRLMLFRAGNPVITAYHRTDNLQDLLHFL